MLTHTNGRYRHLLYKHLRIVTVRVYVCMHVYLCMHDYLCLIAGHADFRFLSPIVVIIDTCSVWILFIQFSWAPIAYADPWIAYMARLFVLYFCMECIIFLPKENIDDDFIVHIISKYCRCWSILMLMVCIEWNSDRQILPFTRACMNRQNNKKASKTRAVIPVNEIRRIIYYTYDHIRVWGSIWCGSILISLLL